MEQENEKHEREEREYMEYMKHLDEETKESKGRSILVTADLEEGNRREVFWEDLGDPEEV